VTSTKAQVSAFSLTRRQFAVSAKPTALTAKGREGPRTRCRRLSIMESSRDRLSPTDGAGALREAEASRAALADGIAMPPGFSLTLGAAIAVQIATTAVGLGDDRPWLLLGGLALFGMVAAVQLAWFRAANGVWLGGFASRVVLGTGTTASLSYMLALGAALWAAFAGHWWMVAMCALAGGAAYALSGVRWLRAYREQPALHARGESAAALLLLTLVALAGLALLVLER
jgi:hypothetical protein